jgi:ketosteroid isomerase-like protein
VSEQENLEVVDKAYEAFGQGDVAGVLDLLAEDVHWSTPGPPEVIPYAGLRTGHEQVEGYFERQEDCELPWLRRQRGSGQRVHRQADNSIGWERLRPYAEKMNQWGICQGSFLLPVTSALASTLAQRTSHHRS